MTGIELPPRFAGPARRSSVSPIARTLEIVDRTPGMISFACGNPATEALPVEAIAATAAAVVRDDPARALQYVRPRGILQPDLCGLLRRDGMAVGEDEILPTTGAIQALALVAHALLEPGDVVVCECPTYPVNLSSFKAHGARTIGVPMDAEGMRVDLLDRLLAGLAGEPVKAIYVIPDAQNPTGITMSERRRHQLVRVAAAHGVTIIEDAPYRQVRYRGEPAPAVTALARAAGAGAALVGSFAKTIAPGLRAGYLVADRELIDICVQLKQGEDFCTSGMVQLLVGRLIQTGVLDEAVASFRRAQGPKLEAMLAALDRELGGIEGVRWTEPEGGLFVWLTLREGIDSDLLLARAIEEKVAFIPGRYFYPDELTGEDGVPAPCAAPAHELRLNFSDPPRERIGEGVAALARVIRAALGSGLGATR